MDNLNEMGLNKISHTELKKTDGGLIMYPAQPIVEFIVDSFKGAYEYGYDEAQENCKCN